MIHGNQVGYVTGRYIGEAIRVTEEIMTYTDRKYSRNYDFCGI